MFIKSLAVVRDTVLLLIVIDVVILAASMAQVAHGDASGAWSPFWRVQAEFVANLLWH